MVGDCILENALLQMRLETNKGTEDEKRPSCTRCKASGIQCEGYNHPPVFVDETKRWSRRHEQASPTDQSQHRQCNIVLHQRYSLHGLLPEENDILKSYFLSRFVADEVSGSALMRILVQTVTDFMPERSPQQLCVKALTAGYYGITNRDHATYCKGVDAYARASRKLHQALEDPNSRLRMETLISVLCLCIYENIVPTYSMTWLTHYEAVSNMVCHSTLTISESGLSRGRLNVGVQVAIEAALREIFSQLVST